MKRLQGLFCVLLLFLFLSIEAAAMNTGFSIEALPEKDKDTFLENLKISLIKEEPTRRAIDCFDVNDSGLIAIGQNNFNNKILCVYTSDGIFQYGYRFNCSGNFGIEWDDTNINIYFARSDVIAKVNSKAKIEVVSKVKNTIDNNSYLNHFIYSTKRISGNTVYTLRNDMGFFNLFASNYSQLVATNTEEKETVLYDVNSAQFSKIAIILFGVLVFVALCLLMILRWFDKQRKYDGEKF